MISTFVRNDIWTSPLNFLSSILREFPNSAVAEYSVGALYMKEGKLAEAEVHINRAITLSPNDHNAWYDKGVLCTHKGEKDAALAAFSRSIALHHSPEAYFGRALLYMNAGKYVQGAADAEMTLAVQPRNARAWYIKGYCMGEDGNNAAAIDCFSKAIDIDATEPLYYVKRGKAYMMSSNNSQALGDLHMAIAIKPDDGEPYYYRGVVNYYTGKEPCADFTIAASKGYQVPAPVMDKLCHGNSGIK